MEEHTKMEKSNYKFGDIEIEKQKFHQCKMTISVKDIDLNKRVVSNKNKVTFGRKSFKHFISFIDAKKLDLMHISSKNECI